MTLPTFGKRQPSPPTPSSRGRGTPSPPPPVAVFGEGASRPGQGRQVTYENTKASPPITVKGIVGTPPVWSTNTYYREDVQLEEAQLTPVERGHVYTAVMTPSVGMWHVTALRLLDEEGACLLDGLRAESTEAAVRTRFQVKIRDPYYMSEGFYLPDDDLIEFRRRVLEIGGLFFSVGPVKGEAAAGAALMRQQVHRSVDGCRAALAELLEMAAQISDTNWPDMSRQMKDRMAALGAEYAAAVTAAEVWKARVSSSSDDPDAMMAHHIVQAAVRYLGQSGSAQSILQPARNALDDAIRRVADGAEPAPFNADAALAVLEDKVWWLRRLRQMWAVPERMGLTDSVGLTALVDGIEVTFTMHKNGGNRVLLPQAAMDKLVEAEMERRRAAERAVAPATAIGGRFDLE